MGFVFLGVQPNSFSWTTKFIFVDLLGVWWDKREANPHLLVSDWRYVRPDTHTFEREHRLMWVHTCGMQCESQEARSCIWGMCLVFYGKYRTNSILHIFESPNVQFALSNAYKRPSNFKNRNNLCEMVTNDKFAPTNSRKKNYNAHNCTIEFKNRNLECILQSHPKVWFAEVKLAVRECTFCTIKFNFWMQRCYG